MVEHLPGTHRFNLQHHHPQLKRKRKKETIMEKKSISSSWRLAPPQRSEEIMRNAVNSYCQKNHSLKLKHRKKSDK